MKTPSGKWQIAIGLFVILSFVLMACTGTPTATPTKAAAPTTAPAAGQATATKPAAPAATAAPAASGAKGSITAVIGRDPDNFDITTWQAGNEAWVTGMNVVEALTHRDTKTNELVGLLAEKWEQTNDKTWRFTLRKGIKFHNGEAFTAQAVAYSLDRALGVPLNGKLRSQMGAQITTNIIDDYTIDVVTETPDPIVPIRVYLFPIIEPKWAQANPNELPIKLIGTGPYKFTSWTKGQSLKLTANDEYWGPNKPSIKDVTILWREEAGVRAAMLQTNEAQIALRLSVEDAKKAPKVVNKDTVETYIIRVNTAHPQLKEVKLRQALNYCVDRKAIVDNILGGVGTPAAQQVGSFILGHNPNLKPYPYDVEKGKQLVKESGYTGQELTLTTGLGKFAHDGEVHEAVVNYWKGCGINVKENRLEDAKRVEVLYSVGAGQPRGDLVYTGHGVEGGDASRSFDSYLVSGGRLSTWDDPKATEMGKKAGTLTGKEREKAYQDLFAYVYEQAPIFSLFHLQYAYGMAKNLEWEPRMDAALRFVEMKYTN